MARDARLVKHRLASSRHAHPQQHGPYRKAWTAPHPLPLCRHLTALSSLISLRRMHAKPHSRPTRPGARRRRLGRGGSPTRLPCLQPLLPARAMTACVAAGAEVMRHDVSVPLVTAVVLSAVLFAVAEGTRLTMRCSNTIAASLDGAFMLTLAAIVTLVSTPPSSPGLCRLPASHPRRALSPLLCV